MDLYGDPYHVSLRSDVDRETMGKRIQSLKDRLDQPDPVSGELHPRKEILETELANAARIFKDGALQAEILAVDSKDTGSSDSHITFKGGLNTYQPGRDRKGRGDGHRLCGKPRHKTGDGTRLQLVQTQYHGSSAAWTRTLGNLKPELMILRWRPWTIWTWSGADSFMWSTPERQAGSSTVSVSAEERRSRCWTFRIQRIRRSV